MWRSSTYWGLRRRCYIHMYKFTFDFSYRKLFQNVQQLVNIKLHKPAMPGVLHSDAGRALDLAIDYPYRPRAVKLMILISDTDTQVSTNIS